MWSTWRVYLGEEMAVTADVSLVVLVFFEVVVEQLEDAIRTKEGFRTGFEYIVIKIGNFSTDLVITKGDF